MWHYAPLFAAKATPRKHANEPTTDDWPTIQCQPADTDAVLQAQRDADHAREVAEWLRHNDTDDDDPDDHIPPRRVIG